MYDAAGAGAVYSILARPGSDSRSARLCSIETALYCKGATSSVRHIAMISTPVTVSRPSPRIASRVVPSTVLRPARLGVQLHATYSITVKRAEGEEATFECDDDVYILDAAEEAGVDLPYSCRSGNCSTCIGKRVSGDVDQSDAMCVDDDEKAAGWTALCVGYPQSNLVVLADQEQEFMAR